MSPEPWSWHPAWGELGIAALLSLAYVLGVLRYGASRTRMAAFAAGILLALAVLVSPLSTIGLNYLLSAHLFQNVALAEWAPALVVLGVSPAMAAALGRGAVLLFLTHPLVALPLWVASYAVWHIPAVYDAALRNEPLLQLEHASYFVTGLLLWWPVFQDSPHDLSSARRAAYLLAAFLLASPVGLLLALLPEPIYEFYENAPRPWDISALADQQVAGVIMAGTEAVFFFAAFSFFVLRFFVEEGG
jgi:cytochrome c oxidase assembly factor CtaG